jgi:hypothetical protein
MIVAAFSHLAGPVWVTPRYLLISLMPFALLAATGTVRAVGSGRPRFVYLTVVLLVLAATAYRDQRAIRAVAGHAGGNYKQAAQLIQRLDAPGDAIVFQTGRTMRSGIQYHLRDEPNRPADVLINRSAADRDALSAGEYADPAPYLRHRKRVWLVVMDKPADPVTQKPSVAPVLHSEFTRTSVWRFSRTTVALYTRK